MKLKLSLKVILALLLVNVSFAQTNMTKPTVNKTLSLNSNNPKGFGELKEATKKKYRTYRLCKMLK